MSDTNVLYEQRRYSAFALQHPQLTSVHDLKSLLGNKIGKRKQLSSPHGDLHRVEYLSDRSYYPDHIAPYQRGSATHRHHLYVASVPMRIGKRNAKYLLLASPYTRLLGRIYNSALALLDRPSPNVRRPLKPDTARSG